MKKITFLLIALISFYSYGQEAITDGDFESVATGLITATTTVGVWSSSSGGVNVQDNTANSYEGTKYVNMGNDFRNLRQYFTTTMNTEYTVRFRYRNNFSGVPTSDAPFVSVRINDGTNNGNGTIIESGQIDPFYDADLKVYTEHSFTFNSGANTDLVFYLFKNARAAGSNPNNAVRIDVVSITPSTTASVDDLAQFGFKSYPNPVADILHFRANETVDKVEVYNLLGQKVAEGFDIASGNGLNVGSLKRGVYIVKATINNTTGSYKIVKK